MSFPALRLLPFVVLGMAVLAGVLLLLPEGTALWRRLGAGCLGVGLGFHVARAFASSSLDAAARGRVWLECLAFPLGIIAFLLLPGLWGWGLLAACFFWRSLVAGVVR